MYSSYLQEYVAQLSHVAQVDPYDIEFLRETLACFIGAFGKVIGASTDPEGDLLKVSIRLLLLDDALGRVEDPTEFESIHYLIGMGFEQTGELLARYSVEDPEEPALPLESDDWFGLTLALLHYLAGGHRVQAWSVVRHLELLATARQNSPFGEEYSRAAKTLRALHSGGTSAEFNSTTIWTQLLFEDFEPRNAAEKRITRLAKKIRDRKESALYEIGLGFEEEWLALRQIDDPDAIDFWKNYLGELRKRGISSFTREQTGHGFNDWLQTNKDLLVVLPTGSGKTLIGELKTALTLAQGRQVIWILPTRALVRQTRRELKKAFSPLKVNVEELPTTEDFLPLFTEGEEQPRFVAASTPEKLAALIRANPNAISGVGLVVVDEAQILAKEERGTTVEMVLQRIREIVPSCQIALMSGIEDRREMLEKFLSRIGGDAKPLISNIRPTRRVYGVLLADNNGDVKTHPVALLYPPGIQGENEETIDPFKIVLQNVGLPGAVTAQKLAERFVAAVTPSGIRTVFFINRPDWTETKAIAIAQKMEKNSEECHLPSEDTARLRVELGRTSTLEITGKFGVAPHHGGLTPLEQHIVEKWTRDGVINTVTATATLAEGVNLPFDLSVVSSTDRFNPDTKAYEALTYSEILNMLGRAGRAGYVSDGICLLSIKRNSNRTALQELDASRTLFFHPYQPSGDRLGLSRLVGVAKDAPLDTPNWLDELDGAKFAESQSLISFVLSVGADATDPATALQTRMQLFPSLQELSQAELDSTVIRLEKLLANIKSRTGQDGELLQSLQRTGMPIEVLEYFLNALRGIPIIGELSPIEQLHWADQVVHGALEGCAKRKWHEKLIEGMNLAEVFNCLLSWRAGIPLVGIETNWALSGKGGISNQIKVGKFLNHKLSVFAQFWGALAVCAETLSPAGIVGDSIILRAQTFVREGVESIEQFEWLRAIGYLDRVLAHALAAKTEPLRGDQDLRSFIRYQINKWRHNRDTIPADSEMEFDAIVSVLNELG